MLFDTHTHYDDERYRNDLDEVLADIKNNRVSLVVNCGADLESSYASVKLTEDYDFIYTSVGFHPHNVDNMTEGDLERLRKLASKPKVVAIGEIGLDYYYENSHRDAQKRWFRRQLDLAVELNLPVIIHNRDAHKDTLDILSEYSSCLEGKGVIHCFSGSAETAKNFIKLGFYIAFGGALTFKNARKLVEAAEAVPMEYLLIETDCPYLSPEPHRGKRNSSAYINYVAKKLAEIKGVSQEEVEEVTFTNGKKLFRI